MITDKILQLKDNQMANQFEIFFPQGIPGGGDISELALRIKGAVPLPDKTIGMWDRIYKGVKIPFPVTVDETDKSLTLIALIDQTWEVYDALKAYHNMIFNSREATAYPISEVRTIIGIRMLNGQQQAVKTFLFKGAFLTRLKVSDPDYEATEPQEVEMEWKYVNFED